MTYGIIMCILSDDTSCDVPAAVSKEEMLLDLTDPKSLFDQKTWTVSLFFSLSLSFSPPPLFFF